MPDRRKIIRAVTSSQSVEFFAGLIPELKKINFDVIAVSSDGPGLRKVTDYGGRFEVVEMKRRISIFRDLKSLWNMILLFRREKPFIVHSMTPKAGLICMLAARLTDVPIRIHTFTGLVFPTSSGLKRRVLMTADWLTSACATHIIPEGEGVRRDLLSNGITKKDIKVLGFGNCRGIDLSRFDRTVEVMTEADKIRKAGCFTFITIGRLVRDKGINELVEAFCRINKDIPNLRLILVGSFEADLDPIHPATLNEINENPNIEAVGPRNDVRPWLAASDCAVLPSYREGFPNVVIEAGAMGLPQIVTDINGANEIIEEGKNGTIVSPRDSDALYHAMKRMISDEGWRNTLAGNARAMIANRYEQSFVRNCMMDFYKEIITRTAQK